MISREDMLAEATQLIEDMLQYCALTDVQRGMLVSAQNALSDVHEYFINEGVW